MCQPMGMNSTTATKPQVGTTVTAIRDIVRGAGTEFAVTIPSGTTLTVTDSMDRASHNKIGRVGVRVPGTNRMSVGVIIGQDVR